MEIEKEIFELKETQKEHSKLLLKIEAAVCSEESTGRKGYGERLNEVEKDLKNIKTFKYYLLGAVAGITAFINWLGK